MTIFEEFRFHTQKEKEARNRGKWMRCIGLLFLLASFVAGRNQYYYIFTMLTGVVFSGIGWYFKGKENEENDILNDISLRYITMKGTDEEEHF